MTNRSEYVLGTTDAERARLTRQAEILRPYTSRLFADAGLKAGQRVLDIGSGVGDVAMLAAQLVGPTGSVVGVERDPQTINAASARIAAAGVQNVDFVRCDLGELDAGNLKQAGFDAVVGRFILQFLPDPGRVIREVATLVRPGGVVAFQEPTWAHFLTLTAPLSLATACASLIHDAFRASGAKTDMGTTLYRGFRSAGLPPPSMRLEVPTGPGLQFTLWLYDLYCTVEHQVPKERQATLGDRDTLQERLESEFTNAETFGCCVGLISAWTCVPV